MKIKVFFALLFLCSFPLFSQQVLDNFNTSWSNVLSGVVISEPAVTSYGFCTVTDARAISAYSNEGKFLWEKSVGRSKNVYLTALPDDFILYSDLSNNSIKMLNPSGTEIWSKILDYKPRTKPFFGRDGRFFICGEKTVSCYGVNGICKWKMETEIQKNLPVQELPDGSLIVFLKEDKNQTRGLRISPFGEKLEEIIFAGEIKSAFTCNDGILLIFTDGASGLFSIEENLSHNRWVIPKKITNSTFAVSKNKKDYLFVELGSDGIIINEINKENGAIIHSIKLKSITGKKIQNIFFDDTGILFIDDTSAGLYSKDGNEIWFSKLPERTAKSNWNYITYTNENYLIFCYKNWTLNAYRVIQSKHEKSNPLSYSDYIKTSQNFDAKYGINFSSSITSDEKLAILKNGFYGVEEQKIQNNIISICSAYSEYLSTSDFGTRKEKSIFDQDSTGFEKILSQLMLLGNQNSQNLAASILGKTQNKPFQKVILQGFKVNGYDPDGNVLKSLEKLSASVSYKDKVVINNICDAVYSVCLFMGRPAYNSKGKDILKNFLYPSYDAKTREYARDTLKKIIALEL